ncbi:hypothetical protein CISIN_1g0204932mg, partial [Citrus sinensis]
MIIIISIFFLLDTSLPLTIATTMAFHFFIIIPHEACLLWQRNPHSPVALKLQTCSLLPKRKHFYLQLLQKIQLFPTALRKVVGWPPIRSFRKNLAGASASKLPASESPNDVPSKTVDEKPAHEPGRKNPFVKINMDGVPIGRKVDLNAYDSYEKLSAAVDELFRGLLAAQRDSSAGGIVNKQEEEKAITGVLDGSGEYTLVYEDNEGDRMLVGDVPWHMFVSTVTRLRVLKSSEVSALSREK